MPFRQLRPDLFLWTDTCNVFVLRDGDRALLIDLGDGSVIDHLQEINVHHVDWVLFTHHHREQCQGGQRLATASIPAAAPHAERALFEQPTRFRKAQPSLGDEHSVYGASYVRPPIQPIPLARTFQKMDDFTWRGKEFWCLDTRGDSPGGMSYLLRADDGWWAFTGDLMLDGAKMRHWFDAEWDYGYGQGIYALHNSAAQVAGFDPALLLPSHGPPIERPQQQLTLYQKKLRELARHYLRGYELNTFAGAAQDSISRPTAVPHVWQVSQHLYKFRGPDYWPNFTLLLSDTGRGLAVDCGLFDIAFLDKSLRLVRERLGLRQIDAVIVTHMHGDHCQEAPHLREKWNAKLWTLDRVVPLCEHPERFDYSAPINTYGKPFQSIQFDRILRDGETFEWEGFTFTADWMPGQTEFALCLHGDIDGRKVAFTGDNLFASTTDSRQTGHEAVVARNSCILEESYLYAADYLHGLAPDLILGGHSWVLDQPRNLIERYRQGALDLRAAFQALSPLDDYRYFFDPYWVRAYPYRLPVKPSAASPCQLIVRNFRNRPQRHAISIVAPPGLSAQPARIEGEVADESIARFPFQLVATRDIRPGPHLVAFDITLDGQQLGQLFDMIALVEGPSP